MSVKQFKVRIEIKLRPEYEGAHAIEMWIQAPSIYAAMEQAVSAAGCLGFGTDDITSLREVEPK